MWNWRFALAATGLALSLTSVAHLHAQASAIPSAQKAPEAPGENRGRKLLDQMVQALGGDAWLNRKDWIAVGKAATFYKGSANPYVTEFERYYRMEPYGERVVIVSKMGIFIPTTKRDIAEVWTLDDGYEITFRGKKELPKDDVADYKLRRAHMLEVVVKDWLKQPDVLITYEGTDMVGRRLADKVSILTANNDGVVLELDETTHLPLSRSFQSRNPTFHDLDTDLEQYDDYHPVQGIMTPLTITRLKNGDMVSQRFLTKVTYNVNLDQDLFNPERPLAEKIGKH
jgi:hypothetical protein